jgi:Uma2 family endonuclease
MAAAPVSVRITAEGFLDMPESAGHELVDGEIVELPMGFDSSWVGGELHGLARNHVRSNHLGIVAPQETGIQVWADDPDRVRKPDFLFIKAGRLPRGPLPTGWLRIVPDCVAEVVSSNELAWKLQRRVEEYREAGVPLIWVIFPEPLKAQVYRAGHPMIELGPDDALDGEDILPGFRCPLAALRPVLD